MDCFDLPVDEKPVVTIHYEVGDADSKNFFADLVSKRSVLSAIADITLVPFGRSTFKPSDQTTPNPATTQTPTQPPTQTTNPTTLEPTTPEPTTVNPTTPEPTTVVQTTLNPTTLNTETPSGQKGGSKATTDTSNNCKNNADCSQYLEHVRFFV